MDSPSILPQFEPFAVRLPRREIALMCLICTVGPALLFAMFFGLGVQPRQVFPFYLLAGVLPFAIIYHALSHYGVDSSGIARRLGAVILWKLPWSELTSVTVAQSGGGVGGRVAMFVDRAGRVRRIGLNWENADRLVELAWVIVDPAAEKARCRDRASVADAAAAVRDRFQAEDVSSLPEEEPVESSRRLWFLSPESPGVWVPSSGATLPPICINCLRPSTVAIPFSTTVKPKRFFLATLLHQATRAAAIDLPMCDACHAATYRPKFLLQLPHSLRFTAWFFSFLALDGCFLAILIFFLGAGMARWVGATAMLCFAIIAGSLPACIVFYAAKRPSPRQLAEIVAVDYKRSVVRIRFGNVAYAKLTERLNGTGG